MVHGETSMMNLDKKPNGLHIMLPFPNKILMPNKKAHWGKKFAAAKVEKEAAYILAYNQNISLDPTLKYKVTLVFCPPDNRKRDLDNLVAAMKSALDGMCRGLGIDDKNIKPNPDWGPVVEGGKVEVTIFEIPS